MALPQAAKVAAVAVVVVVVTWPPSVLLLCNIAEMSGCDVDVVNTAATTTTTTASKTRAAAAIRVETVHAVVVIAACFLNFGFDSTGSQH